MKAIPAKVLFPNGEEPVAIDIYERLGDFAFTVGIFATKAYIALALI